MRKENNFLGADIRKIKGVVGESFNGCLVCFSNIFFDSFDSFDSFEF